MSKSDYSYPINWERDRDAAILWARRLIDRDDWLILDTETTGLDERAEIIQIGVVSGYGNPLIDNILVKPTRPIPAQATAVHHITDETVKDAPSFKEVWPRLLGLLKDNEVVIYNSEYDVRLVRQTANLYGLAVPDYRHSCAMLNYAAFLGEWNEHRQSYRWPKLQGGDHSAVGDCKATLELIERMAFTVTKELREFVPAAKVKQALEAGDPLQGRLL